MPRLSLASALAVATLIASAQDRAQTPHSVWDGVYTLEQASRGEQSYRQHCLGCHGENTSLRSTLWGEPFWNSWREAKLDDLYLFVRDNMPNRAPGELEDAMYIDIIAYILRRNDLPPGTAELKPETSVGVAITGKEGAGEIPDAALVSVGGCLVRTGPETWILTQAGVPSRYDPARGRPQRAAFGDHRYPLRFIVGRLDRWAGQSVAVTGLLIGEGGTGGINLMSISGLSAPCAAKN
jgi:S-disulfanyl-L-cysteine oxidoreductase SoxD